MAPLPPPIQPKMAPFFAALTELGVAGSKPQHFFIHPFRLTRSALDRPVANMRRVTDLDEYRVWQSCAVEFLRRALFKLYATSSVLRKLRTFDSSALDRARLVYPSIPSVNSLCTADRCLDVEVWYY